MSSFTYANISSVLAVWWLRTTENQSANCVLLNSVFPVKPSHKYLKCTIIKGLPGAPHKHPLIYIWFTSSFRLTREQKIVWNHELASPSLLKHQKRWQIAMEILEMRIHETLISHFHCRTGAAVCDSNACCAACYSTGLQHRALWRVDGP